MKAGTESGVFGFSVEEELLRQGTRSTALPRLLCPYYPRDNSRSETSRPHRQPRVHLSASSTCATDPIAQDATRGRGRLSPGSDGGDWSNRLDPTSSGYWTCKPWPHANRRGATQTAELAHKFNLVRPRRSYGRFAFRRPRRCRPAHLFTMESPKKTKARPASICCQCISRFGSCRCPRAFLDLRRDSDRLWAFTCSSQGASEGQAGEVMRDGAVRRANTTR